MTALAEGCRVGPYQIIRLLGAGGMGAVYEARQEPLDRRVALKALHRESAGNPDAVARFFNEAKIISRLQHPSIVQVSDFGYAQDGTVYFVMEYLRGQSLGHRLLGAQHGLPIIPTLQVAWQVADVLAVAHAQGVVHRDLKPDNLMLVADPVAPGGERVKVLDFGIAKLTDEKDRGTVKTDAQIVMGTPTYMSPEQCAGAGGVDAKTDVYSLGCLLFEALAGRPPFIAEGSGQLIGMHLFRNPPLLASVAPQVPPAVAALVDRLLTKDKAQRPGMSRVADELGALLSKLSGAGPVVRSRPAASPESDRTGPPIVSGPSTLDQSIGQQAGTTRRKFLWGAGASLAIAGSVVLVWQLGAVSPPARPAAAVLHPAERQLPAPPPAAALPPARDPPPTAAPRLVSWKLETQPPGATVLDEEGHALGVTPWNSAHPAASGNVVLHLRRSGYGEAAVVLDLATDTAQVLTLSRQPPAPGKNPLPRPRAGSPSTRHSSSAAAGRIGYEP